MNRGVVVIVIQSQPSAAATLPLPAPPGIGDADRHRQPVVADLPESAVPSATAWPSAAARRGPRHRRSGARRVILITPWEPAALHRRSTQPSVRTAPHNGRVDLAVVALTSAPSSSSSSPTRPSWPRSCCPPATGRSWSGSASASRSPCRRRRGSAGPRVVPAADGGARAGAGDVPGRRGDPLPRGPRTPGGVRSGFARRPPRRRAGGRAGELPRALRRRVATCPSCSRSPWSRATRTRSASSSARSAHCSRSARSPAWRGAR